VQHGGDHDPRADGTLDLRPRHQRVDHAGRAAQDGQSTARVTVLVTNETGQPVAGFPLRLDMWVPSNSHVPTSPLVLKDVGELATKFPVTGGDGRAHVTYTAPLGAESGNSGQDEIYLTISATPVGSDYSAALPRSARIRLVPLGTIIQ